DLLGEIDSELVEDRVYALTPKGEVVDLPVGATPLDFAYHVDTEVGHRCRGAKVGGRIVPLDYRLRSGDRVEILTAKTGEPGRAATGWTMPTASSPVGVTGRRCAAGSTSSTARSTCRPGASCSTGSSSASACSRRTWRGPCASSTPKRPRTCRCRWRWATSARTRSYGCWPSTNADRKSTRLNSSH